MAYTTQTPKRCTGCDVPTKRRATSDNRPLCLDCGLEAMKTNVYAMTNPDTKWRRAWLEGIRDKATSELTKMDEAEALTRQQIPDRAEEDSA